MKKRIPIKLHTVNIIEMQTDDNVVECIRSFNDTKKGNKAAEKLFKRLVKENTEQEKLEKEDYDAMLEDGYFEEGSYKVVIQHG